MAKSLLDEGMPAFAEKYAYGPTRVQFENKDPRGFAQFKKELGEHSALGSANTQIGCQGERPSLYDLVDKMRAMTTPTLMVSGINDKQVNPDRVRDLQADLGSDNKIFIDLGCASHNAMWEKNHLLLFAASLEFLDKGTVNGQSGGLLKLGY